MRLILSVILSIIFTSVSEASRAPPYRPASIVDEQYVPTFSRYDRHILFASILSGVNASLLKGVVRTESAFNRTAVSNKGAQGLMQLMPSVQSDYKVDDPFDSWKNIMGGAFYLADLIKRFGREDLALAAYNAGPSRVNGKIPNIKGVSKYVTTVFRWQDQYQAMDERHIININPVIVADTL